MPQTSFQHDNTKVQREFERLYQKLGDTTTAVNTEVTSKITGVQKAITETNKVLNDIKLLVSDDGNPINSNTTEIDFLDSDTVKFTAYQTATGVKVSASVIETSPGGSTTQVLDPRVPPLYLHAKAKRKHAYPVGQYWFDETAELSASSVGNTDPFAYFNIGTSTDDTEFDLKRRYKSIDRIRIQKDGYYRICANYYANHSGGGSYSYAVRHQFYIVKNPVSRWWTVDTYQDLGEKYTYNGATFIKHAQITIPTVTTTGYYIGCTGNMVLYIKKGTDIAFASIGAGLITSIDKHKCKGYFNIEYCGEKA